MGHLYLILVDSESFHSLSSSAVSPNEEQFLALSITDHHIMIKHKLITDHMR